MADDARPTYKVRTRMEPDREIEVGEAELVDLRRQGLLIEDANPKSERKPADRKDA